jgi:hypothetical protein
MEILQSPFRLPTMERGTAEKQVKSLYFEGVLPAFFITPPAWNSVPLKKYLSMVKSHGSLVLRHSPLTNIFIAGFVIMLAVGKCE